jgi:hypothetical protein
MSERVTSKVKEVAKEDFDQAKALAQDAFRSAAYLYPFKVCHSEVILFVSPNTRTRAFSTSSPTARYGSLWRRS